MKLKRFLVVALVGFALAACGGGGGGGASTEPPVDSDAPTFQFSERFVEQRASDLSIEVLDNGSRLLRYAQFATDIAHRFAGPGSPASVTANCAYTGRITLQLDDRDGNSRASAGDAITAVLDNCGVPALARAATGTLRVDIVSATPSTDVALQARLTVVDTLRIAAFGGPNIGPIVPGTLRGSMDVQWSETATGAQLRAVSAAQDDLRFTAIYDGIESTDAFRKIDVSQTLRYDIASITSSMAFLFDVGSRGGMLRVRSPQPFQGDLNALPKQFRIDADIARGRVLRSERYVDNGFIWTNTLVLEANGLPSSSNNRAWGSFLSLMKDPRDAVTFVSTSDKGGGQVSMAPWRDARATLEIDYACWQNTGAGPVRADALFQKPVAGQPALTAPGSLLKVQFGRAIADTPELRFRLADAEEVVDPRFPTWNVDATTVRHGAYFEIRPAGPLRQGRTYYLQSSYDGNTWAGERIVRDPAGSIVNLGDANVAVLYTDTALIASAIYSDFATVAASAPARLRSGIALRDGQTISSYRWQQISGVPLVFSAPQAAQTDAIVEATGPSAVGDALVQLTVTDSLGNTDRLRIAMKAGDHAPQGAVLYTETRAGLLAPRREMITGAGSVFYGPEPGRVLPRVPGPTEGGTGANFSVTPANGGRLAVGVYANTVMSSAPGAQNGLIANVYCNTPGSPVSGSFEVLDVAYANDGTISRLAIDFMQQCDAGLAEFQRGSYRLNSALPLRP